MAGRVLVGLKSSGQIAEIVPFIDRIVQPGMRVLFLVPYGEQPVEWWRDRRFSMEAELQSSLSVGLVQKYPWEKQMRLARERVFSSCEALRKKGIEVAADLYEGSLRKALKGYTIKGDVDWIILPTGRSHPLVRLLRGMLRLCGLVEQPGFHPVLLLSPIQGV